MGPTTSSRGDTRRFSVPDVERLADQVETQRTELATLRAALEELRAEQSTSLNGHRRRRRRWDRRAEAYEACIASGLVSRRRLFGLLGGAAAAGAGLAMAGSMVDPDAADATTGTMSFGTSNDAGTASTTLTSTNTTLASSATFIADNTSSGNAVFAMASGTGTAVFGSSASGYGVAAAGGQAPLRILPAGGTGQPTTGAHLAGETYVDSTGALFNCTTAGSPGTWVRQAPLIPLPAPHRVYDSRTGQPNQSPNVQGSLTFTSPPPSANQRTITLTKDATSGTTVIPNFATAVLLNLTVISISGVGALAVFPTGAAQPNASSINWSAGGQVLANGLTSACNTSQQVGVAIVASSGASTNFILDAIGYYP